MYPLNQLTERFEVHRDPDKARAMAKYMKNQFPFFGIQAAERRAIGRDFVKEAGLPPQEKRFEIIKKLWAMEEREYQLFGMEILDRFRKKLQPGDIEMYQWMITHKPWWDTVDYIATNLVGYYGTQFPADISLIMERWLNSGHLWLQRSTLIYQLKYKQQTDLDLLSRHIMALKEEKDFFIRKAIGWALREYSKTSPGWVREFVNRVPLAPLSTREALKWMQNKGLV